MSLSIKVPGGNELFGDDWEEEKPRVSMSLNAGTPRRDSRASLLLPPEPLFHFKEDPQDLVLNVHTLSGNALRHSDHIDVESPAGDGAPCHDPVYARRLSKWFIARASKEMMFRQGEDYNYMKATGEALLSTDGVEGAAAPIAQENFAEVNVYDSTKSEKVDGGGSSVHLSDDSQDLLSRAEFGKSGDTTAPSSSGSLSGLKFDSNFESGNLWRANRVLGRKNFVTARMLEFIKDCAIPMEVDQEYDLTLRHDINTSGNIQWYYFSASAGEDHTHFPLTVRFNLINMQKSDALYNYGMKPATYSESRSKESGVSWVHGCRDICYYKNGRTELKGSNKSKKKRLCNKYSLSFTYTFEKPDTVFFAHCFPYTYTMMQNYLNELSGREDLRRILRRKQLCKSVLGNRCDLLTITGPTSDSHESRNRKAIVISARVHPGETNSSFMMQGVIDFLISDSEDAQILRQLFVFKIVPMLNPDGVIHGNYRCSIAGADLNRRYNDAHCVIHPEIVALKELVKETQDHRGVLLYLDLHGHSRNKNAFFYGCDYFLQPEKLMAQNGGILVGKDAVARKIYPRIFPKILSSLSNPRNGGYFEFRDCSFKVQKSKLGTGRVVSWLGLGVEGAYTVELSFCGNGNNKESQILKRAFAADKFVGGSFDGTDSYFPSLRSTHSDQDLADSSARPMSMSAGDEGRDEGERGSTPVPTAVDQDGEFITLLESYKAAKHYTQGDYKAMGRDLCTALRHFANVRTIQEANEFRIGRERDESARGDEGSPRRTAHEFLSKRKSPVETLVDFNPNCPLVVPSVFSTEAINAALESSVQAAGGGGHGTDPVGKSGVEPSCGYRIYSEIAIRRMLKIDVDQIESGVGVEVESFLDEEEECGFEEAENDNGSDSDPSIDTTPMEVVMKRGELGERAMSLMGMSLKKARKKAKRQSNARKPASAPKEIEKEEVVEVSRRRIPPRVVPIGDRRRREQSAEGLVTLSSGSTQRLMHSHLSANQSHVKTHSIVFPADDELKAPPSIYMGRPPRASHGKRVDSLSISSSGPSSAEGERLTQSLREYRKSQSQDLSQSQQSARKAMVSSSDRDMQVTLQTLASRYRGRANSIKRQTGLSSLDSSTSLSLGKKMTDPLVDGAMRKMDITTCRSISALSENIRSELDNLALGMKANNLPPW